MRNTHAIRLLVVALALLVMSSCDRDGRNTRSSLSGNWDQLLWDRDSWR